MDNNVSQLYYYYNMELSTETTLVKNAPEDIIDNIRSSDRGYGFIYREKMNEFGVMKMTKVGVYTSETAYGARIRNAESGIHTRDNVGSLDEYLYFKVGFATGELNTRNGSNLLFYDSPWQYENHHNTTVSDDIKEKWAERRDEYCKKKRD